VTWGLCFSGLVWRTSGFSYLLRHTRGCKGPILNLNCDAPNGYFGNLCHFNDVQAETIWKSDCRDSKKPRQSAMKRSQFIRWIKLCIREIILSFDLNRGCLLVCGTWSYFAFVGGLCCLTLDFVIPFWTVIAFYTLLISLFCIWNKNKNVFLTVKSIFVFSSTHWNT
jgi:hypothetical protein